MRLPPGTRRLSSPRELAAVGSPLRQEVLEQLGHSSPASVADLARRMGRRATALHYHVNLLCRAGLLRRAGRKAAGARSEALYALAAPQFAVVGAAATPAVLRAAVQTIGATLRLAQREAASAILSGAARERGGGRPFHTRRHRACLSAASLARVNRLLDEISSVFETESRRRARTGGRVRVAESAPSPLFALTFVLSPSGRRGSRSSEESR